MVPYLGAMTLLQWVALASLTTALLWVPYVLSRMLQHGIAGAVGNPPDGGFSAAPWAQRAQAAHRNAIENLVVFAALAFAAQLGGHAQSASVLFAAQLYVVARISHFAVYVLGIPWLRTFAFVGGFVAQVLLAVAVLS